ncbi:MAG: hypothetical protein IJ867_05695 [Clostridia bacterium]|nr:hypothetical protein [Clostridia bacterium]
MEENENKNENVEVTETVEANETTVEATAEKVGGIKSKKGLIIGIVVALIAICIIFNVFFNTKGKAKSTIKNYLNNYGKGKYVKAMKQIDPAGRYVFRQLDEDEYEDFWTEYKEFKKSDEWDDVKEEWEERIEDMKDEEEDFDKDDKTTFKIKKITKFKKVGKNLYQVKAKIKAKQDGEEDEDTLTFYVMKKGLGTKLVNVSGL